MFSANDAYAPISMDFLASNYSFNYGSGSVNALTIDSSGNVGIGGVTNPRGKLEILQDSTSNTTPAIKITGSSGDPTNYYMEVVPNLSGSLVNYRFNVKNISTYSDVLCLTGAGNVGIGTTSPNGKLDVVGGRSFFSAASEQFGIGVRHVSTGGPVYFGAASASATPDAVISAAGGAALMTLQNGGNVGIGTESPATKLDVYFNGASIGASALRNTDSGSAAQNYALFYRNTTTQIGSITGTNNATAYNTSSDYRLKTNLEPIQNGINRIKQLPVYQFNWINDQDANKVDGFVAHEAKEIVPECVVGEKDAVDADGNPIYQGIDQSKIVPLLTAALKEAISKIEILESKVAALEAA
jgi:hypothetical protein